MNLSTSTPLAQLYIFCSDEVLLLQEAVDALRQKARAHGYTEREVYTVDAYFNWSELLHSLQSPSLFGDLKIIELRIPSGKPGKEGADALQEMLKQLNTDNVIIVTLPKLAKASKSTTWYKALTKSAGKQVVEIPNIELAQLPKWIQDRAKINHQSIDSETAEWMSTQFEGNLLAAYQEIQKLNLLYPQGPIDPEHVRAAVLNVARYDMFKVTEPILSGNVARTIRTLEGLKAEGEPIIPVIWSITAEVRVLNLLKRVQEQGGNLSEVMSQNQVWYPPRTQLIPKALPKLSAPFLRNCLSKTVELDRLSKGIGNRDPWEATLELANKIALKIAKVR